ncbi:TPA: hypothetical protein KNG93_004201 [Escherichia coli]|nr:hypothetical protein [Escherichia coli]
MKTELTLNVLQTMNAQEYEDKGQRRFANRASRRCGGSLLIACRVPHTRMSPCRRG